MKTFFLLLILSFSALGAECPWVKFTGLEMMAFDSDRSVNKPLSSDEVKADLSCLKLLFDNFYVAQMFYGQSKLSSRLEAELAKSESMSGLSLMNRIFALHEGMPDIHLSYFLGNEVARFNLENKITVDISEELDFDVLYERGSALYFRPGSLVNLSPEQKSFIELVRVTDKNLIIDLRGNGGGDDDFAYALTEALFTKKQKIPLTKRHQVHSPLQRIGFSLSLIMFGYDSAESYRNEVKHEVGSLAFKELLPYSISEEREALTGKRASSFESQITLIIDGECASSCETIVEKLSQHPKVKIIGTNTAGALHFSNAITFMLPYSGIIIRLPTLLHQYENDVPEGVGYYPHEDSTFIDLQALTNQLK